MSEVTKDTKETSKEKKLPSGLFKALPNTKKEVAVTIGGALLGAGLTVTIALIVKAAQNSAKNKKKAQ